MVCVVVGVVGVVVRKKELIRSTGSMMTPTAAAPSSLFSPRRRRRRRQSAAASVCDRPTSSDVIAHLNKPRLLPASCLPTSFCLATGRPLFLPSFFLGFPTRCRLRCPCVTYAAHTNNNKKKTSRMSTCSSWFTANKGESEQKGIEGGLIHCWYISSGSNSRWIVTCALCSACGNATAVLFFRFDSARSHYDNWRRNTFLGMSPTCVWCTRRRRRGRRRISLAPRVHYSRKRGDLSKCVRT